MMNSPIKIRVNLIIQSKVIRKNNEYFLKP